MTLKFSKLVTGLGLTALLMGVASVTFGATVTEEFRFAQGSSIEIENLVGRVKVRPAEGAEAYLKASVIGESEELVKLVRFELKDQGKKQRLEVLYPEGHRNLYFESSGAKTSSNVRYQGEKYKLSSTRRSGAEALQVDLELFLPKGSKVDNLKNVVGEVELAGVDADIRVDVGAGSVSSTDGRGRLVADTGSGGIFVTNHEGDTSVDTGSGEVRIETVLGSVDADTGSGSVKVTGVSGSVSVDTGSGNVVLEQIIGDRISADTGSGSVKARDIRGSFQADTGSGSVQVDELADSDAVDIDTGSGDVRVRGDLGGVKRLKLSTGSGDVEVRSAKTPNMSLTIKVSSGDIDVDIPGMAAVKSTKTRLEASLGDGSGKGVISTGSGDVIVRLDSASN
ncbi:MAG: DUF4097 domain-containing protein [Gammaproteobacteria bacterium]|nr:DUF4097 domain-containing protein [Gammaproteobacteria bacterium]